MTDKPTRSQLMELADYLGPFTGSHYAVGKEVKLKEFETDGPAQGSKSHVVGRVTDRSLAQHREAWVRDHWEDLIDHYVDDGFAVEDPEVIEDKPCPREAAHGDHDWDYSQFPQLTATLNDGSDLEVEFHCLGVKAHPSTTIGGAHDGRPAEYGQIDVSALTGGALTEGDRRASTPARYAQGQRMPFVMGGASIGTGVEKLNRPECDGSSQCTAKIHEHGCYLDVDGSACNDPMDHEPVIQDGFGG